MLFLTDKIQAPLQQRMLSTAESHSATTPMWNSAARTIAITQIPNPVSKAIMERKQMFVQIHNHALIEKERDD
jgi:hypothetical protein